MREGVFASRSSESWPPGDGDSWRGARRSRSRSSPAGQLDSSAVAVQAVLDGRPCLPKQFGPQRGTAGNVLARRQAADTTWR